MATQATTWTNPPVDEDDLVAWLHRMCETDPVQRDPEHGGWHVFGYPEAMEVLYNYAAFSSTLTAALPEK